MSKLPRITGEEAKKAFEQFGFEEVRRSGSHCIMKKEGHEKLLSIPMHRRKTLGVGLLKSLIDAAGIETEEFTDCL